ncbi:uncharacterized protein [Maniola hyperantus]|uniref:uncharacterized protein n=1 Tax=Aphantopus hyperantus TaxID=2795564 RepID=UPI00374997FE
MRQLTCFIAFALVGLLAATPTSNDENYEKVLVRPNFYIKDFIEYKAKHDIVNIVVPLNWLNFRVPSTTPSEWDEIVSNFVLFFVEADVQPDGSRVDQGLYVFKEGKATKILDNGRDAATSSDESQKAFFGAKDGLYVYNQKTNSADKYGPITDSIISIDMEKLGEVIYILTEDGDVYKVTDNDFKMRLLTCFTAFALVGLLAAAPTSNDEDNEKVVVTQEFYIKDFVKYKAEHDIVNLIVPINSLNFEENDSSSSESNEVDSDFIIFFVEADVQPDGSRVDQGLYVLKEGKAKKILDYGRDAAASGDDSKKAFFGAKDGLYVYNRKTNSADKYGPITDSIIAIDMEKLGEVIYILTEDLEVYKVTDNGEKKENLEDVVKAKQIVVDFENNLYFFSDDKVPYVRTADDVKKIEGLPEATGTVTLFKPPFFLDEGAPVIINNKVYLMYPNGTSEDTDFEFEHKAIPTALAPEATLVQYYAYDKKIYEYNVLALIISSLVEEITDYLQKQSTEINKFASKKTNLKRKLQPSETSLKIKSHA